MAAAQELSTPMDAQPIADSDEALLAERCAFLKITPNDCGEVRDLRPTLAPTAADFITSFYQHLQGFPSTAAFLSDKRLVERLKETQLRYFESLLDASLEATRVAERRRIGERHAEVGLEPPWFLGTFSLYMEHGFKVLARQPGEDQLRHLAGLGSLMKLILLDIGFALDAYYNRATTNLRQALSLYTQSNTELREFARLASHDLKTPLATIAGLCEEFLDEFGPAAPKEGRALILEARERTLKMKGMIDELLTLSEEAAQPSQRHRVSLRSIVDEALGRVRTDFGGHGVIVSVPNHLPEVFAHPARLREALYQLLSNAIKYMDKQPGQVWLEAEANLQGVHLRVGDNGPGIAPADQDRVFAPFRRLSRSRGIPGNGLGLYVVRQIIEEQGGRVWCESAPGGGSLFHITLPPQQAA